MVFLCHIVSIQVDKQGLDIFKPDKSCIYPLTLNSVLWSLAWGEVVLGFKRLSQKPHFKYFKLIQIWFKFERHTSYSTHSAYIFTHTALDANPIVWGHLDEVEKILGLESCCSNPVVGFFWTLICRTGQNPSLTVQDSNGPKNSGKNQKIDKPEHIAFLCHIVSIQVDK